MIRACKDWPLDTSASNRPTAAFLISTLWTPGQKITVSFIDPDAPQWKKKWVEKVITENLQPVLNLKLVFGNLGSAADIRITFSREGAYSRLGKNSTWRDSRMPESMNFGWLDEPYSGSFTWKNVTYNFQPSRFRSNNEVGAVVLHEFGHAMGMIHEHQNPQGGINWNVAAVQKYFRGPPNYWSNNDIDQNVLSKYSASLLNASNFDPKSIMLYAFPASLTNDGVSTNYNTKLSQLDTQWLQKVYGIPSTLNSVTSEQPETPPEPPAPEPPAPEPPMRKTPKWWIKIIIVVSIVALLVLIFEIFRVTS